MFAVPVRQYLRPNEKQARTRTSFPTTPTQRVNHGQFGITIVLLDVAATILLSPTLDFLFAIYKSTVSPGMSHKDPFCRTPFRRYISPEAHLARGNALPCPKAGFIYFSLLHLSPSSVGLFG